MRTGGDAMSFENFANLESREIVPGYHGRFVHTDRMTLSYWEVEDGAVMPEHAHPHEQMSSVIEGRFELRVGDETRVMEPGMVAVIPGDVPHAGRALTPCRIIDVFHPARDDYR
jgi:quercetin dioxygenase-like cupin family protein